jgi:CheY-like chemotaxis protein
MQPRVLIVEDREYLRQVMIAILEDRGYVALGLGSAAEALAGLPALRPDLILLDLELPGMSGREFLMRVRETALGANLPVLVISAHGDHALARCPRHALGVLAKPFDNDVLIMHVERMLDVRLDEASA